MSKKYISHFMVFIPDENCFGVTESLGAFASMVKYNKGGIEYTAMILNEDLIFVDDMKMSIEEEEI